MARARRGTSAMSIPVPTIMRNYVSTLNVTYTASVAAVDAKTPSAHQGSICYTVHTSKYAGWYLGEGKPLTTVFMDVLKKLFERHFHSPVTRVQPLQGQLGGSGRQIIRLANEKLTAIGILYDVREENVAFLEFSRHFRRHGLPVPEIYGEDLGQGAYLEEDLGSTTLFEFL